MTTMRNVMNGAPEAFVVNPLNGATVRHLTVIGDDLHILAGSDEIIVPLDTPLIYEPWMFDRGSLLFDSDRGRLKFCTELDILRLPDGTESAIEA